MNKKLRDFNNVSKKRQQNLTFKGGSKKSQKKGSILKNNKKHSILITKKSPKIMITPIKNQYSHKNQKPKTKKSTKGGMDKTAALGAVAAVAAAVTLPAAGIFLKRYLGTSLSRDEFKEWEEKEFSATAVFQKTKDHIINEISTFGPIKQKDIDSWSSRTKNLETEDLVEFAKNDLSQYLKYFYLPFNEYPFYKHPNTLPLEDYPLPSQIQAHQDAKKYMKEEIGELDVMASYKIIQPPIPSESELPTKLNSDIFWYEVNTGVQNAIQNSAKKSLESDSETIELYGVASQFNGCEATNKFTPPPGMAWSLYCEDFTQGPGAQLQFGHKQVEIINKGANLGFNGLINLLTPDTYSSVKHGYFSPEDITKVETWKSILKDNANLNKIEYQLIGNIPFIGTGMDAKRNPIPTIEDEEIGNKGRNPVYMLLTAAPALGMTYNMNLMQQPDYTSYQGSLNEICFSIGLANYRALFAAAIKLSLSHPNKQIIVKTTAVGLGVFENPFRPVAEAYKQACLEFQEYFGKKNITVPFQLFQRDFNDKRSPAYQLVNEVGLVEKNPA